jgi:hypothetical protein
MKAALSTVHTHLSRRAILWVCMSSMPASPNLQGKHTSSQGSRQCRPEKVPCPGQRKILLRLSICRYTPWDNGKACMKYRGSALRTELTKINLPASHSKGLSYILQGAFAVISCKNESLAGLFSSSFWYSLFRLFGFDIH